MKEFTLLMLQTGWTRIFPEIEMFFILGNGWNRKHIYVKNAAFDENAAFIFWRRSRDLNQYFGYQSVSVRSK